MLLEYLPPVSRQSDFSKLRRSHQTPPQIEQASLRDLLVVLFLVKACVT